MLLAHGTGDDNVHFENTVQFVQGLIDAGIPYDLQIFPAQDAFARRTWAETQLFKRILAQFETYLKPEASAVGGTRIDLILRGDERDRPSCSWGNECTQGSGQEEAHSQRHQDCEHTSIHRDPMCQGVHLRSPFRITIRSYGTGQIFKNATRFFH